MELILCKGCDIPKSELDFYAATTQGRFQILQPCIECRRSTRKVRNRRQEKYGLESWVFELILKSQGGKCATCPKELGDKLFVDHDHSTGIVRGLLCHQCNSILGLANDSASVLRALAEYLDKPRGPVNSQRVTATPSVLGGDGEHGETRVA